MGVKTGPPVARSARRRLDLQLLSRREAEGERGDGEHPAKGRGTGENWPRCTLPAEDLYLSNSVFPLETIIFLERFPLERESFFNFPHTCLFSCVGAPLTRHHIVPFTKVPKITFYTLKTAGHPAFSSSLIPRSASSQDQPPAPGNDHGTTPRAPFAGYSSRLHMFISTIFPVNFLERFFLGDLYLSICLSRSIHLA